MNERERGPLRPGWGKPELIDALTECVAQWERVLAGPVLRRDSTFLGLQQRARELDGPARSVGFGGIGHHLAELSRVAEQALQPEPVRAQLEIVKELVASARSSLSASPQAPGGMPGSGRDALAPPPLLSGLLQRPAGLDKAPPAAPSGALPPPPVAAAPTGMAPPRLLTMAGQVSAPATALPPMVATPPPPLAERPPSASAVPAPPPVLGGAAPPAAIFGGAAAQPTSPPQLSTDAPRAPFSSVPPAASRPRQPNLLVRSVLGLRAFGRKEGEGASLPPGAPGSPGAPQASSEGLLGLRRHPTGGSGASPAVPPSLGGGYGGLPALREPLPGPVRPSGPSPRLSTPASPLERLGGASQSTGSVARGRAPATGGSASESGTRRRGGRLRRRGEAGESRWWVGALAALGICAVVLGVVLVVVMITRRNDDPIASAAATGSASVATGSSAAPVPSADTSLPRSRLLTDDERLRALLAQVHGRGKESAELRALLDEQAATAAQALKPGCIGAHCAALAEVGKLVTAQGKRRVKRRSKAPDAMRSRWLAGLDMPELPVEDDPRVQRRFEFYTENPLGRETFQQMLFRCGAYKDSIQSSLIRRGMPKDLIAVAYAESGCYPLAKSPVGAEGLWQFIPDAARAYHLRIIEGVVDERHSPQKATEAAIQYMSDMYAKFGDWNLVFSSYNMGPFGLAARLERVEAADGGQVGFWELVDAEMLPGETTEYAPAIQAIALILNNLQKLKFGGVQQGAPQMTMDLPVPPSTRMTMVARAAGMQLGDLMRLNLDIKGTSTPAVNGFAVQVPKDSVWQARDVLAELIKTKDDADLCAPAGFDWGRQRFTTEMQEACRRNLSARGAGADPSAAP